MCVYISSVELAQNYHWGYKKTIQLTVEEIEWSHKLHNSLQEEATKRIIWKLLNRKLIFLFLLIFIFLHSF